MTKRATSARFAPLRGAGERRGRSNTYANIRKSGNARPGLPSPFGRGCVGRRLAPLLSWKVWAPGSGAQERDGVGGLCGPPHRRGLFRIRSHGNGPKRLLRHQRRHRSTADGTRSGPNPQPSAPESEGRFFNIYNGPIGRWLYPADHSASSFPSTQITWLSPPKGHISGGTVLTIYGSGFKRSRVAKVRFATESQFDEVDAEDRKSTRLNSSHSSVSRMPSSA